MLPSKRRIRKKEFSYILLNTKRFNSTHLLLSIAGFEQEQEKLSRFAFSVSKKVAKRSVDRNRLRRRGYSIISKYISDIKSGYFFVFSFKKGSEKITFIDLEKEILELLKSCRML